MSEDAYGNADFINEPFEIDQNELKRDLEVLDSSFSWIFDGMIIDHIVLPHPIIEYFGDRMSLQDHEKKFLFDKTVQIIE